MASVTAVTASPTAVAPHGGVSTITPTVSDPSQTLVVTITDDQGGSGTASYGGGSNPQTWPGFELTSGSAGHAAGSDGLDVGIRSSNGGPPTGGGSTPTSTVAPAVTGTATHGNVLTSTQGTWTVTGNVPTAYTYQWFDCPTATFSTSTCSTILTTAVASFNLPTYTLQASDEGDYVFSYVTVTNANGTANAVSNGVGPVN